MIILLAAGAALAMAAPGPKAAVLVLGTAGAGELQVALETRLGSDTTLTTEAALMAAVAPPAAAEAKPEGGLDDARVQAAVLLEQAKSAYYEDRTVVAMERLDDLSALEERFGALPTEEVVHTLLWRTAVFLAKNEPDRAKAEAAAALVLQPDLAVPTREFRPSVRELVEATRAAGLTMVSVTLTGLPEGAQVTLDDRPVAGTAISLVAGRHRLAARAPGRRMVSRVIEVHQGSTVAVPLPLDVDPALAQVLFQAAWSDVPAPSRLRAMTTLADKLGVDWLFVAAIGSKNGTEAKMAAVGPGPARSFHGSPATPLAGATEVFGLWVEARIHETPVAAPAPQVPVTLEPSRNLSAALGFDYAFRSTVLSSTGSRFSTDFAGYGPHLSAEAGGGGWITTLDARAISYAASKLNVSVDGASSSVNGGSDLLASVGGGWFHRFGEGDREGSPSLALEVGGSYEQHHASDLIANGADTGLLVSSVRESADLSGRFALPVIPGRLLLTLGGSVSPLVAYAETPSQASGSSPHSGAAFMVQGGARYAWRAWSLTAGYREEHQSVSFSGPASVSLNPPMSDVKSTEVLRTFGLSFGRSL